MQDRCPPPSGSHLEIIATKRHKNCENKKVTKEVLRCTLPTLQAKFLNLETRPEWLLQCRVSSCPASEWNVSSDTCTCSLSVVCVGAFQRGHFLQVCLPLDDKWCLSSYHLFRRGQSFITTMNSNIPDFSLALSAFQPETTDIFPFIFTHQRERERERKKILPVCSSFSS